MFRPSPNHVSVSKEFKDLESYQSDKNEMGLDRVTLKDLHIIALGKWLIKNLKDKMWFDTKRVRTILVIAYEEIERISGDRNN
jgi:hypothetical protein